MANFLQQKVMKDMYVRYVTFSKKMYFRKRWSLCSQTFLSFTTLFLDYSKLVGAPCMHINFFVIKKFALENAAISFAVLFILNITFYHA